MEEKNSTMENLDGEVTAKKKLSVMSVNKTPKTSKRGLEYEVELKIMREDWCRNGWRYENLEKNAKSFAGTPILCAYIKNKLTGEYEIGSGHNVVTEVDAEGNFAGISTMDADCERIVGKISDNEDDIRVEEENGKKWIFAKGILWGWYHKELVEKILQLDIMEISAETLVENETKYVEEIDGKMVGEVYPDWYATGVTILGDNVPPAMPEASIRLAYLSKIKTIVNSIENAGNINGSENKITEGEKSKVEIKLDSFQEAFPDCKLLRLSANNDFIIMLNKNNEIVKYPLNSEDIAKEDFDIKSMSVDESNFTLMETTEKSRKIVKTLAYNIDDEEVDVDVEDTDCKCDECVKKQEKIDELENALDACKKEMQSNIDSLQEKVNTYETEKRNNRILEAVKNEQVAKECDLVEEAKVSAEDMQKLYDSILEGKYQSADEAIKDYKVMFADKMEEYNKTHKQQTITEPVVLSMGNIPNPLDNSTKKDPIAFAKERFGNNKN